MADDDQDDRPGGAGAGGQAPGDPTAARWLPEPADQRARLAGQVQHILSSVNGARVHPAATPEGMEYLYLEGRILVRDADLQRVAAIVPGQVADALVNGVTAWAPQDIDTLTALELLDDRLGTGVATPDHLFHVAVGCCCPADEPTPSTRRDPDPPVAARGPGDGSGVLVAVVDTGFLPDLADADHPWLHGVTGEAEQIDPSDLGPYAGHGTFVAGVVRSMAPGAQVHVERVLSDGGAVTESGILRGLHRALGRAPDIITMSAGCTTRHDLPPMAFEAFWERRLRHLSGTALVVAAGNHGDRRPFWPAAFEWAVGVGATTRSGQRAPFSNRGSWVDVYALGADLVNAYPDGQFRYREPPRAGQTAVFNKGMATWSGTSFAAPLVAGAAAARMSRTGQSGAGAARSLVRIARSHAQPGVGPVLTPGDAFLADPAGP